MNTVSTEKVGEKTRQNAKWYFSLQFAQKFIYFGSGIILARLLTPADFGLAAMSITLDLLTWFVMSLGINSAIIHFQDHVEERLNAAFWMFIASSAVITVVLMITAPWIAVFYKAPMLVPIIRVSAIAYFIYGFGAVHKTILYKELDFKKVSILETSTRAFKNLLFVVFALMGYGVWSFIYPKIIISVINVVALWKISPWRPNLQVHFKYWLEMFKYGKNVLFGNLLDFILNNSSNILIGSMVGSSALGFYSFANEKSLMTVNNIAHPVTMITFPAFSKLQEHAERLKKAFLTTIKSVSLISFPYTFVQLVIGREYIIFLFGEKWEPSILVFQLLIIYTMIKSVSHAGNAFLQGIGKPDIVFKWNLAYAPIFLFLLFTGYNIGGIYGIAAFIAVFGSIAAFLYLVLIFKVQKWSFNLIIQTFSPSFLSAVIMGAVLFISKIYLKSINCPDILMLIILSPVAILTYAASLRFLFTGTYDFMIENVQKIIGKNRFITNVFSRNTETEQKT